MACNAPTARWSAHPPALTNETIKNASLIRRLTSPFDEKSDAVHVSNFFFPPSSLLLLLFFLFGRGPVFIFHIFFATVPRRGLSFPRVFYLLLFFFLVMAFIFCSYLIGLLFWIFFLLLSEAESRSGRRRRRIFRRRRTSSLALAVALIGRRKATSTGQ